MPTARTEARTVPQIAREFEKLAKALRGWPRGTTQTARGVGPSRTILTALRRVNARLASSARKGSISAATFRSIGREFGTIGTALRGAAAASRTRRTTRTTRRATPARAKRTTRAKRKRATKKA